MAFRPFVQESARQSRIFNAKVRTIGVDVDAITQQVEDKKRRLAYSSRKDLFFVSNI